VAGANMNWRRDRVVAPLRSARHNVVVDAVHDDSYSARSVAKTGTCLEASLLEPALSLSERRTQQSPEGFPLSFTTS
jgi:hypothetical protein